MGFIVHIARHCMCALFDYMEWRDELVWTFILSTPVFTSYPPADSVLNAVFAEKPNK